MAHLKSSNDPSFYLKAYWGYPQFRFPQAEVIASLLDHRDTLAFLPTGAGKSICFQIPALVQGGLTVVVSPLVSLMENQVSELRSRHIQAQVLHSELSRQQRQFALSALEQRKLQLIYVSPETLLSQGFWERLRQLNEVFHTLVIDEAHCLVQWGTTFRPVYRRLGAIRSELERSSPDSLTIAAFTATADSKTQREIESVLRLRNPQRFCLSPYRDNLDLKVAIAWTPRGRKVQLLRFITQQKRTSGLVYTRSRRDSENLAQWLTSQGYKTLSYHAGLDASTRRHIEQSWITNAIQFVVCTCAFGLGINKPDVRWIAHFQPPLTLSEYLQEVGRAGRDGQRSQVMMFVSEPTGWLDPQDRQQRRYFTEQIQGQLRQAQRLVHQLPEQGHIPTVIRTLPHAEMALSLLHSLGQLSWTDPMHYTLHARRATASINPEPILTMSNFIKTKGCRWQFILETFGFSQTVSSGGCGHCDRCQS